MEATVQQAETLQGGGGPSQPPPNAEQNDSNTDDIAIEISSSLMFRLDDLDVDEIDQPAHSDDFEIIFDEEEVSCGSKHSTSKPKEKKKKKKWAVSRKAFLSLQSKLQQSEIVGPQSLAERVKRLEARARMAIESC